MAATIISAWFVASQSKYMRSIGFWCFLLSNILWILWGWFDDAYGLVAMQFGLLFLNFRGALKNQTETKF